MLNGKMPFKIPNVPADQVLLRFKVLFAYVLDAVSVGKGMLQFKIDPSRNQTINNLLHETFPSLKCFDHETLRVINPRTVAYIHALIIDSIAIVFEASINSLAHEHEGAMVDVYSKMNPDSFTSQLQAALTAYYEDIKGVQGASGCPSPRSSSASSRIKRMQDLRWTQPPPAPPTPTPTPPTPTPPLSPRWTGGRQPPPRRRLAQSPALPVSRAGSRPGGVAARRPAGAPKKGGK
jgi:hypothetical protein